MHSRRTALKTIATAGVVTTFSGLIGGIDAFAADGLRVRRGLHGMDLDDPDLVTYREFVGMMQGMDQSKALSWTGFANQHGSLDGGFKFCPHGDWYFLPWHRGFVLMYENAARKLTGNDRFAMPFWDWTKDRNVPQAFSDKLYKGKANPLYVATRRDLSGRWALTDALVGPAVIESIYNETHYELFGTSRYSQDGKSQDSLDMKWVAMGGGVQGVLERTPHNNVHNNLGGYMPTAASPLDPLFFMHHGNIDRIWAHWNGLGRLNSTDPLWLQMAFTNNYLTPEGTPYTQRVDELLDTKAFGYTYNDSVAPDNRQVNVQRDRLLLAAQRRSEATGLERFVDSAVTKSAAGKPAVGTSALKATTLEPFKMSNLWSSGQQPMVRALLNSITVSPETIAVRVFVNHPNLKATTADSDPHFVTTISFLHHGGAHAGRSGNDMHSKALPSTMVDLSEALRRLGKLNKIIGNKVSVQLVPVGIDGIPGQAGAAVTAKSIDIDVL
jgi:tyrosinase